MKQSFIFLKCTLIISSFSAHLLAFQPAKQIINQVLKVTPHKREQIFIRKATDCYLKTSKKKQIRSQKQEQLNQIASLLTTTITHFHDTPGFRNSLHVLLASLGRPETKGYVYELQKALDIHSGSQGKEQIKQFNGKLPINNQRVYIDLLTSKRIIECKALQWSKKPDDDNPIAVKLCNQFLRQKEGTRTFNSRPRFSLSYEVHSCFPVPIIWKEWFEKHDISVIEEKK